MNKKLCGLVHTCTCTSMINRKTEPGGGDTGTRRERLQSLKESAEWVGLVGGASGTCLPGQGKGVAKDTGTINSRENLESKTH